MAPETLDQVKLFLRISHSKLDEAITGDILACLADLRMHGICYKDESDPLILNAVKLWCKSVYTDDTVKSAEYLKRYTALRDRLKVAEGYGWKGGSDE
jgi:hypothetical protein